MVSVNNFISFLVVTGFFVGVIFAIAKLTDPVEMLIAVVFITSIFYIISLAGAAFFIKSVKYKPRYRIKKEKYETSLDSAIIELEKREDQIKEIYEFIRELEQEEYEEMRRDSAIAAQAAKRRI